MSNAAPAIRSQRTRAFVLALILAVTIGGSALAGTPSTDRLPDVSLVWPLLFHVERAGALIAIVSAIVVVGWRASRGELPIRFANIEYRVDGQSDSISSLERRVALLEFQLELRDLEEGSDEA